LCGSDEDEDDTDFDGVALDEEDWSEDFTDDDKEEVSNIVHDSDYAFRVLVQNFKYKFE